MGVQSREIGKPEDTYKKAYVQLAYHKYMAITGFGRRTWTLDINIPPYPATKNR